MDILSALRGCARHWGGTAPLLCFRLYHTPLTLSQRVGGFSRGWNNHPCQESKGQGGAGRCGHPLGHEPTAVSPVVPRSCWDMDTPTRCRSSLCEAQAHQHLLHGRSLEELFFSFGKRSHSSESGDDPCLLACPIPGSCIFHGEFPAPEKLVRSQSKLLSKP